LRAQTQASRLEPDTEFFRERLARRTRGMRLPAIFSSTSTFPEIAWFCQSTLDVSEDLSVHFSVDCTLQEPFHRGGSRRKNGSGPFASF
jgi:hypothetical protein